MLISILVFAILVGATNGHARQSQGICRGVEAILRMEPTTFNRGARPKFAVVLKNVSTRPARLIDVREGRRPDLANSYYQIIVERNGREVKDLPRPISDPGPLDDSDFFMLLPGSAVEVPLTTTAEFGALQVARYSAHIRLTLDPFSAYTPRCRSASVSFSVRK